MIRLVSCEAAMQYIDCRGKKEERKHLQSTLVLVFFISCKYYLLIHIHFLLKYSFLNRKNHILFIFVSLAPEK